MKPRGEEEPMTWIRLRELMDNQYYPPGCPEDKRTRIFKLEIGQLKRYGLCG